MNSHQWSFAKQSCFKSRNRWTKSAKTSWSQNGWWNKPTKLQFHSIFIRKILMLSKRSESTKVDCRTWLHVPWGLIDQPAVTLTRKLKYKKRLLLRCIHHFKSYLNWKCIFLKTHTYSYIPDIYGQYTFTSQNGIPYREVVKVITLHNTSLCINENCQSWFFSRNNNKFWITTQLRL